MCPPGPLVHPGRTTHFYPRMEETDWTNPLAMLSELASGKLRPLFQNHGDVIYWVEIPHPFFLATLWGSLTDWTLWAIPLVFTAYFLLLLVSVYGVVKSVSDEWTRCRGGGGGRRLPGAVRLRSVHPRHAPHRRTVHLHGVDGALIGWAPTLAPMRGLRHRRVDHASLG